MPRATPLPPPLAGRPFTVAEARALGVSPKVLRGSRLRAPFRGVRVPTDVPDDLPTLCRAAALVLPDGARFSHTTAAQLRDVPVPAAFGRSPVHVVCVHSPARVDGVVVHRRTPARGGSETVRGLRVSDPESTWCEVGELLDVDDLVVAGDHLLRRGLTSARRLADAVGARDGRRGVRRLRRALSLLEDRVDSPMETRLRLLLLRAGLPRPCVNRDVVEDGAWLARPDLSYPAQKIAIEYEGDHHRTDRRQWKNDKARRRLLEDHGWLVIEVIDDDVYRTPELTVARVRPALAARAR